MRPLIFFVFACFVTSQSIAQESNPVVREADGFVVIKGAKMQPDKAHVYKAIYDATKMAKDPKAILPALNMAGSELNALAVCGIALSHAKFVVVFHGEAISGILDNQHYKEKYGVDNPNLAVFKELRQAGVQLFVCGQNLLAENIDPKTLAPEIVLASDALIVLMTYQNRGYALMSF